jgi:hypothetical protein
VIIGLKPVLLLSELSYSEEIVFSYVEKVLKPVGLFQEQKLETTPKYCKDIDLELRELPPHTRTSNLDISNMFVIINKNHSLHKEGNTLNEWKAELNSSLFSAPHFRALQRTQPAHNSDI